MRKTADIISILHPVMQPEAAPCEFTQLSADKFREIFESSKYVWIAAPSGADYWRAQGCYTTKDCAPQNKVYIRFSLLDADQCEVEHIDISASSAVAIAATLWEFAISTASVNGDHAVIAQQMVDVLSKFLAPDRFSQFRNALAIAAREQIRAEILVTDSLAKHGGD
jgi:hypothetical protein